MIHVYWKSKNHSKFSLILLAILSLGLLGLVENALIEKQQPYYEEKFQAAQLAEKAFHRIRDENERENRILGLEFDPSRSGLIGLNISDVTSNVGSLSAKRTSINPNFAAVIVQLLKQANLKEGDNVAVALSGSFPAMNISVYAAMQTLRLNPTIIASVSSSQWGANHNRFLWLDMESILHQERFFSFRSSAATLGGVEDRALGMSEWGKRNLRQSIERNRVQALEIRDFSQGVEERVNYYAKDRPITQYKAYINIGGGAISIGTSLGKKLFPSGLIRKIPEGAGKVESVTLRFLEQDIPVINVTGVEKMAKKYGLPLSPKTMPRPGEGKIFAKREYNLYLLGFSLASITSALFLFRKKDIVDQPTANIEIQSGL